MKTIVIGFTVLSILFPLTAHAVPNKVSISIGAEPIQGWKGELKELKERMVNGPPLPAEGFIYHLEDLSSRSYTIHAWSRRDRAPAILKTAEEKIAALLREERVNIGYEPPTGYLYSGYQREKIGGLSSPESNPKPKPITRNLIAMSDTASPVTSAPAQKPNLAPQIASLGERLPISTILEKRHGLWGVIATLLFVTLALMQFYRERVRRLKRHFF